MSSCDGCAAAYVPLRSDTRAPFYASLLANIANILLEPLLIFTCGWGVMGAAGAIAIAQVSCTQGACSAARRQGASEQRGQRAD